MQGADWGCQPCLSQSLPSLFSHATSQVLGLLKALQPSSKLEPAPGGDADVAHQEVDVDAIQRVLGCVRCWRGNLEAARGLVARILPLPTAMGCGGWGGSPSASIQNLPFLT